MAAFPPAANITLVHFALSTKWRLVLCRLINNPPEAMKILRRVNEILLGLPWCGTSLQFRQYQASSL